MTDSSANSGRDSLAGAGYVACGLVVIGSLGPWSSMFGRSVAGTSGAGVVTLVCAVVGAGSIYLTRSAGSLRPRFRAQSITVVVGMVVAVIAMLNLVRITSHGMTSPRWGIWVVLLSGLAMDAIGLQLIRRSHPD